MRLVGLLAFLAFFLVAAATASAELSVGQKPVHDSITEGESAAFDLAISNGQNSSDTFRFSTNDLFWSITSDPLHHYFSGVEIGAGETRTVRLMLRPDRDLEFGRYRVDVAVRASESGASRTASLFTTLRPANPLLTDYFAAVRKLVEVPGTVDPRSNVTVKVNLANRNPKDLEELRVRFSGRLLNREISTSLGPLEKKTIEETFALDPLTPPQTDALAVELIFSGDVLDPVIREDFEVGAYPDVEEEGEATSEGFLVSRTETVYRNSGNVRGSKTVEAETNLLKTYFTSSDPEAFQVKRDGKRYLAWQLSIEPGASATIVRTTSYRPLLLVLLLMAVALALRHFLRSQIKLTKRANVVHVKDTGISEIRIFIRLRNLSKETCGKMTIKDAVPMLAKVSDSSDAGVLKPDRTYHDGSRTVVKWELKKLEGGEERILSYSIKTRFAVLGPIVLPPAFARFHDAKGKKILKRSGKARAAV